MKVLGRQIPTFSISARKAPSSWQHGYFFVSLAERFTSMVDNADEIKSRMATKLTRNRQLLGSQF